jgi:hypothetical protein
MDPKGILTPNVALRSDMLKKLKKTPKSPKIDFLVFDPVAQGFQDQNRNVTTKFGFLTKKRFRTHLY